MKRVLVTGGAGFIGSHLCDALLEQGCEVMVFDCLADQVHGKGVSWPDYMTTEPAPEGMHYWFGDVRDSAAVAEAVLTFRPDTVVHLAAATGVASSGHQIAHHASVNVTGTAILLEMLTKVRDLLEQTSAAMGDAYAAEMEPPQLDKALAQCMVEEYAGVDLFFLGSSASVYGAGHPGRCTELQPHSREADLSGPDSVHGATMLAREHIAMSVGNLRGLDVRIGRIFEAYGPRQCLTNPQTGLVAGWASRLLAGKPPVVYGDGVRVRDFIYIDDVVSGVLAILDGSFIQGVAGPVFNIGTGVWSFTGKAAEVVHAGLAERALDVLRGKRDYAITEARASLELKQAALQEALAGDDYGDVSLVECKAARLIVGQSEAALIDALSAPMPTQADVAIRRSPLTRAGEASDCYANNGALRSLGWLPKHPLSAGLAKTIDWWLQQPPDSRYGSDEADEQLAAHGLLK